MKENLLSSVVVVLVWTATPVFAQSIPAYEPPRLHWSIKGAIAHDGGTSTLLGFGVEKEDDYDMFWSFSLLTSPGGSHAGLHFHAPVPHEESWLGLYLGAEWHRGEGAVAQLGLGPLIHPEDALWGAVVYGALWDEHSKGENKIYPGVVGQLELEFGEESNLKAEFLTGASLSKEGGKFLELKISLGL